MIQVNMFLYSLFTVSFAAVGQSWTPSIKGKFISHHAEILAALLILTVVTIFIIFTKSYHFNHKHRLRLMHRENIQDNKYMESNDSYSQEVQFTTSNSWSNLEKINRIQTKNNVLVSQTSRNKSESNAILLSLRRDGNMKIVNPFMTFKTVVNPNLASKGDFLSGMERAKREWKSNEFPSVNHSVPNFIAVRFDGRLGNNMFQYASLLGIAQRNNLIPVNNGFNHLTNVFKVRTTSLSKYQKINFSKTYNENKGCSFEYDVLKLGNSQNIMLNGYFQSWKYFSDLNTYQRLRQHFQFHENLRLRAEIQFLRIILPKVRNYDGKITYIAVHIRRGDMVHRKDFATYGYTSPDIGYLHRGMTKFRSLYRNCLFVISSDDLTWSREMINDEDAVFVPAGNASEMDMAILAQCDHTLMTVGSYSWWVAWLVRGTTIYYSGYPTPYSKLAELFNSADYRPSSWIGMT